MLIEAFESSTEWISQTLCHPLRGISESIMEELGFNIEDSNPADNVCSDEHEAVQALLNEYNDLNVSLNKFLNDFRTAYAEYLVREYCD